MSSLYLKSAIWDFVLVLTASSGLCYTLLNCFYTAPDLQYGPIPAVICAVVTLALFAVSSSRKSLCIGVPILVVATIGVWIGAASMTPGGAYLDDTESNYLIFAMCTTLTASGCYVLSRRVGSAALLFIAGSFLTALVQFLYQRFDALWAIVFVASSLALIVFKNYQLALRASTSVRKIAFAPGFAVALATTAVAVGLGCGIWFGVIAPLDPPAAQIKLITEHRALETIRVKGVADLYQIPNLDMTSDQTNDDERTTDDIKESPNGRHVEATGNEDAENDPEDADKVAGSAFSGINLDMTDDMFDFLNYEQVHIALAIAALLVVAAIVAYFVGRRVRRNRRLERVKQLPPSEQVRILYPFIVSKFERLGWGVVPGQTLSDYALANAATVEQFDAAAGVSFAELTQDYQASAYGGHELGVEASERLSSYYNAFWKACRRKLGSFRYFFKSFRL